jgi:hypothetical protein
MVLPRSVFTAAFSIFRSARVFASTMSLSARLLSAECKGDAQGAAPLVGEAGSALHATQSYLKTYLLMRRATVDPLGQDLERHLLKIAKVSSLIISPGCVAIICSDNLTTAATGMDVLLNAWSRAPDYWET